MITMFSRVAVVAAVIALMTVSCASDAESVASKGESVASDVEFLDCVGRSQDGGPGLMEAIVGYARITPSGSSAKVDWVYLVPAGVDLTSLGYMRSSSSVMLELRDSSGGVVRTVRDPLRSSVTTDYVEGYVPPPGDSQAFLFQVADPPEYDSFTVRWQDMMLPTEPAERSAHAPTVAVSGVCENESFGINDTFGLLLHGLDDDGDVLRYRVFYSTDNGETYQLYHLPSGSSETSALRISPYRINIRTSRIPGSDQARIGISVSDGTRSAFAQTPPFRVEQRAPTVSIRKPEPGKVVRHANFELAAEARDKEDGQLPSSAYSWHSNLDGHLGDGRSITVNVSKLTPGTHTISATVTDSTGRTASDTVNITKITTDESS